MRYLISALKYIKDNYIILLPSLAVAILAFAPAIDYSAMQHITQSFADGKLTSRFSDWLKLFMPFNSENWATVLLTLAAYVALVLDVAYTHSMVDKHIRFGSKSFRSIISSFTINFIYGFICMVVLILSIFVLAVLMALIMSAFALAPAYVFIVGIVLCTALVVVYVFISSHFFLWLPCAEITGFKMSEALYSSYAQAKTVRGRLFTAIALPVFTALILTTALSFLGSVVATIFGSILFGCAYMVVIITSYISYAEIEGIEREDLKKY